MPAAAAQTNPALLHFLRANPYTQWHFQSLFKLHLMLPMQFTKGVIAGLDPSIDYPQLPTYMQWHFLYNCYVVKQI